jgi:hypothetical protein
MLMGESVSENPYAKTRGFIQLVEWSGGATGLDQWLPEILGLAPDHCPGGTYDETVKTDENLLFDAARVSPHRELPRQAPPSLLNHAHGESEKAETTKGPQ